MRNRQIWVSGEVKGARLDLLCASVHWVIFNFIYQKMVWALNNNSVRPSFTACDLFLVTKILSLKARKDFLNLVTCKNRFSTIFMKAFAYVKIVKDLFLTLHTDFKLLNITRSIQRKTTKKKIQKSCNFAKQVFLYRVYLYLK